jgi:hypothetical protein
MIEIYREQAGDAMAITHRTAGRSRIARVDAGQ